MKKGLATSAIALVCLALGAIGIIGGTANEFDPRLVTCGLAALIIWAKFEGSMNTIGIMEAIKGDES